MTFVDLLGLAAGTLTTISLIPQVLKAAKTKSTKDISLGMFLIMSAGIGLWLVYGILINAMPVMAANAVTLGLLSVIIALKVRYK